MKIEDILNEAYLTEGVKYNKTSQTAIKLLKSLEKKKKKLQKELRKALPDRAKKIRRDLFAIRKTVPIIEDFKDYFIRLETTFPGLSEREKKTKIKSRYDEVRFLFLEKLYKTMKLVGKDSAYIIGSTIATLLFAILFIPGGGTVMLLPTISTIRNVNRVKGKIQDKNFTKEVDYLSSQLQKYKRKRV